VIAHQLNTPVIEIDNVTKTFDTIVAVDRVTLRVEPGQTLGLIGPNGAGKTTLLRLISTLAKPDSGDVRILGESVWNDVRAVRRKLGFMPAEFGSPRNLTIAEYLDYFGCMYDIPLPDRQRRINDVCDLTDLTGRSDVMVKGLSTGNKQRLLLAKTLLHDPQVLVLDEPASGLDPRARTELRAIVRELAAMGKTIVISSHILPDIEEISDRIGMIEAGKLVLEGDLATLRATHAPARRVVKLRVPEADMDRARDVLTRHALVTSCERREQFLVLTSDEQNANFALLALIEHDIRILQFGDDGPNLEEIFLWSTTGKVT
jgi:ABC-2 type transport system ATP-binding protein